jgi:hypothetical protein
MPLSVDSLNSGTIKTESLTVAGEPVGPKYKVYTALLTQSGGSQLYDLINTDLTIGVTYTIGSVVGNPDWTNVGAPNNEIGTSFVATGTTPNSWGEPLGDSGLIYNTGAPVVTVLENTIGNIWFGYGGVGFYVASSEPESLFPIGKTVCFLGSVGDDTAGAAYGFLRLGGADQCRILTQDFSNTDSNGQLLNTPIEIRVYN